MLGNGALMQSKEAFVVLSCLCFHFPPHIPFQHILQPPLKIIPRMPTQQITADRLLASLSLPQKELIVSVYNSVYSTVKLQSDSWLSCHFLSLKPCIINTAPSFLVLKGMYLPQTCFNYFLCIQKKINLENLAPFNPTWWLRFFRPGATCVHFCHPQPDAKRAFGTLEINLHRGDMPLIPNTVKWILATKIRECDPDWGNALGNVQYAAVTLFLTLTISRKVLDHRICVSFKARL